MATDILVIEDDAILREAVADWLLAAGYGVRTAADGNAGIALVNQAVPALVVTDIHMPGMTGAGVIAALRKTHPTLPIIAISGLFQSGFGVSADEVVGLGAVRAIAKPFKRRDLLDVIAQLLPGSP